MQRSRILVHSFDIWLFVPIGRLRQKRYDELFVQNLILGGRQNFQSFLRIDFLIRRVQKRIVFFVPKTGRAVVRRRVE